MNAATLRRPNQAIANSFGLVTFNGVATVSVEQLDRMLDKAREAGFRAGFDAGLAFGDPESDYGPAFDRALDAHLGEEEE